MASEVEIEFANYRKRMAREKRLVADRATRDIVLDLIGLVDDLNRAVDSFNDPGIVSLRNKILERFIEAGFEPFAAPGDRFDPEIHMAIEAVESSEQPANHIVICHQLGWRNSETGDLLREASVTVSKLSDQSPPVPLSDIDAGDETEPEEVDENIDPESPSGENASDQQFESDSIDLGKPIMAGQAASAGDYQCPLDFPGCVGDCPFCSAPRKHIRRPK